MTTNETIKKAISRRIKVHVIAFAPEAPITDNDYNVLPGYAALRAVVDATFGFYITPYSGSTNKRMSTSTASEAISDIIDMISNNFDAVTVRPTKTVQEFRFNVGTEKFYIAYRTLGVEPESITFDAKPSSLKLERDTGFWKLMSAQEDSGNTQFSLRYTGSGPDFSVQMLSSTLLRTFAGVTSSDAIDISSPYLAAGALGTLVARVDNENVAVAGGFTVNLTDGITFSPNIVTRPSCQFSLGLGTIACQGAGAGVLSLQSSDGKGSAVPFMCVDEEVQEEISSTTHVRRQNSRRLSENIGERCTSNLDHSPLIEYTPLKRTFAFIARNARDNDTDKSTVDNLIVYPNNLLDYLVSYLSKNPGYYTSFLANIFSAENAKATFQTLDISSYVTYVMNTIHGSRDSDSNDSYDYGSALKNALYTFESYSDIFVVVDSMTDALVVDSSLLETMSQRRVKIYFIMVETYSEFPDGTYKEFSSLAARTGGASFRLSDYDAVRKFLDVYFNEIIGGDLVSYKPYYHLNADGLYVETYSFSAQSDLEYAMLTVNPDGSSKVVSADVFSHDNDISIPLCSPQTIGRDLTFFSFQCASFSVETFQARVYFSSSDETTTSGSVFIFEKNSTSTTSIAFSPTVYGNAISGTPYFNQPQYLAIDVMGLNETEVAVSLRDNNGTTLLNNVLPLQWPGCLFPYIVNYEWWCSDPNSSYQIQVDSTHGGYTTSRTQVVPCVDKGNSPCAHGVYDANIQTCSCDVHWSGTSCQERICQNGGVTMPNNTCSCDSEKYDGDFCQISLENCNSSPDAPYIANEVSSLILVAERLSTPLNLITSADTLKALLGIQIVVVYYGGGLSPSLVLSTTDSSLLPLTLTNYPFENVNSTAPPESPNDAIILGLRSQMTARSLVVLLSRGGDFPVSSALVNELSNRRAELRVFSGKDTLNSTTLAALGNGIPFVIGNRREFEQDYFPNYVVPAASKATLLSSPTLNVIASDNMCNVALTIPAESFSSKLTMFIHTRNSDSSLVDVAVSQGGNVIMNSAKIGQITQKFIISSDVDTSVNIGGSDRCSYSIEMLNYYKIGYTFQSDNLAENGYQGPSDGLNFVSLYAANSLVDYLSSAPYIHLRPIMSDGTLGAATLAATTMRVMSCTYDYYAELSCDGGALGYQAQIHTFLTPSANRQQQVAMACIQQDTCSGNGQQVRGICVCNGGWDGPDCSLPKCVNGGSRLETVCGCPPRYTGVFCEEEMFRNIAFIVDSIGLDDTAFNSSITSMIEFVGLYDMQELRILLIDNADALSLNQNFVTYTTESFSASLNAIFPNRNRANEPKLDEVFSTIDNKTVELNGQHYIFRYIFYVTQTGGSVLDSSILDKVKNQLGFRITCIGVSAHNRTLSEETLGELRLIGSTQTADNWYTAMTEMADVLSYVENTLPIPPPTPLCPNAQMSIFFAVDLSTGVDQYRDTMLSVISQLPTAFNLGYDTLSDNTGCDESGDITAAYKGSSRISGWTYYDKFLGVASPSLCVSNLPTVMKSVENDVASGPDPQFSGSRGLLRTFSQILNNTCLCSRYTDSVTTKAVIWMPISNYTSPDFVQLLGTPYIHYVVPFYDLYAGDFFYGLSRNKGAYDGALPNVAGMSSDTIVDMLWSKLCGDQKPK